MQDDGIHHRPPAPPEPTSDDGDGQGEFANLTGSFSTRPQRQHGSRSDVLGALGPRLGRTIGIGTAPPSLQPDQTGRTPEAGQVP